MHSDTIIIIFAREPVAGQVKTRLIPALGAEGSCHLYQQLLDHTLNTSIQSALADIQLCITPESNTAYFTQLPQAKHFQLSMQTGDDLGKRMFNAMASALNNYKKVILIGTDCPFLSTDDLQQAITVLDNVDMVFSPAYDGGYVLVGAKKIKTEVFSAIDWGTDQVMQQSRNCLKNTDLSWYELAKQHDIDVPEDLQTLEQCFKFEKAFHYSVNYTT